MDNSHLFSATLNVEVGELEFGGHASQSQLECVVTGLSFDSKYR